MSKPYFFYVSGMNCTSCSNAIESFLRNSNLIKVNTFHADMSTPDPKKIVISLSEEKENEHESNWNTIKKLIDETGFTCENYEFPPVKEQNSATPLEKTQSTPQQEASKLSGILNSAKKIITSHWLLGGLGCITGVSLMILTMALGGLPLAVMIPLAGFSILLTIALGAQSYYEAWKKFIQSRTLTMDTLFSISTISVLAVSVTSFFVPWLPMMFEAGLLIYGFRHIGIAIEDTIKEKISSAKFQDRASQKIRLYRQPDFKSARIEEVQPNDIIQVKPGELIPLDSVCEQDTLIYPTIITGAIIPRQFRSGDKVLAGMRLANDAKPLTLRVLKTVKDSYLARLDESIAQSVLEKAPIEVKTGQLLTYFIPAIIAISILSGIIVGLISTPALAIQCAISVLVSACPCTLGLIIPLAVKTGIHKGAEHGVQFKNSRVLQLAEQIDAVIFDLNGTLTTGVPVVKEYAVLNNTDLSSEQFLSICNALEEQSKHPFGKAIQSFTQGINKQKFNIANLDHSNHSGISAEINGTQYTIGSKTLMQEIGISTSSIESQMNLVAGDSLVFLAKNKQLLGYLVITDPLRKDAKQTVEALIKMGKEVHLCTGADEKTAYRYAQALGIKKVHANCVATTINTEDKSKPIYIKSLQNQGLKVAMVGDAANDANAIAASDFGIAVLSQDSDEITQQHASAIIQSGTLLPIANAFAISKQTVNNIKQNLLISLGYNLTAVLIAGGLLVAAGFVLNPAVGVALMVTQACFVLLNVYRFKEQPLQHLQDTPQKKAEPATSSYEAMKKHTLNYHTDPTVNHKLSIQAEKQPVHKNKSPSFWNDYFPELFEEEKDTSTEHLMNNSLG
ncbi:TPA: cation-translocating P-type ATPase [Legionella pneumophila]|nr:heavy metal translocating P-type ATPase [Legionella pneumophila subsp. fraseri]HAT1796525.1 cation-translocating P-type ATPase [Legionella pneumophila]MDW8961771.1 heavy metal translocating P-type ATPase [Legionella pneumophila subsp. fraseri]MDW9035687.1 heavy metal translocating P-type ATPase [Legionella pneumophila subsp. fraseri]MDW9039116.1 heavy metal translocating P-type ATPase [Legionella pneumophila subsp. fraseri]